MTAALLALNYQGLDLVTFLLAVTRLGIGGESNALAGGLYAAGGLPAVLAVKAAGAIAAAIIAWRLAPSRWALLPAVVGLFGAATNLAAL